MHLSGRINVIISGVVYSPQHQFRVPFLLEINPNLYVTLNVFRNMDSNQKAILGFLLGITAGAVAGLLLAPSSGEETRKKLTDKAKGYKDELNGQINSAISKLNTYTDQVKGAVSDLKEKASSQVN
jgi:gas vesicle protein